MRFAPHSISMVRALAATASDDLRRARRGDGAQRRRTAPGLLRVLPRDVCPVHPAATAPALTFGRPDACAGRSAAAGCCGCCAAASAGGPPVRAPQGTSARWRSARSAIRSAGCGLARSPPSTCTCSICAICGCPEIDLSGSRPSLDDGVTRYKRKWGGPCTTVPRSSPPRWCTGPDEPRPGRSSSTLRSCSMMAAACRRSPPRAGDAAARSGAAPGRASACRAFVSRRPRVVACGVECRRARRSALRFRFRGRGGPARAPRRRRVLPPQGLSACAASPASRFGYRPPARSRGAAGAWRTSCAIAARTGTASMPRPASASASGAWRSSTSPPGDQPIANEDGIGRRRLQRRDLQLRRAARRARGRGPPFATALRHRGDRAPLRGARRRLRRAPARDVRVRALGPRRRATAARARPVRHQAAAITRVTAEGLVFASEQKALLAGAWCRATRPRRRCASTSHSAGRSRRARSSPASPSCRRGTLLRWSRRPREAALLGRRLSRADDYEDARPTMGGGPARTRRERPAAHAQRRSGRRVPLRRDRFGAVVCADGAAGAARCERSRCASTTRVRRAPRAARAQRLSGNSGWTVTPSRRPRRPRPAPVPSGTTKA